MDCIFCKLANGEIPTATLYEDDEFRVILDQGPATKGHALILPKQHFANISRQKNGDGHDESASFRWLQSGTEQW